MLKASDLEVYEVEDGSIYIGVRLSKSQRMAIVGVHPNYDNGEQTGKQRIVVYNGQYRMEQTNMSHAELDVP